MLHVVLMGLHGHSRQLRTARNLLQKTAPILLTLNEKAAAALQERDQHICARDRAVQEREQVRLLSHLDTCSSAPLFLLVTMIKSITPTRQIQEELDQANLSLQNARQQIGDLNLQVTIMTSGKNRNDKHAQPDFPSSLSLCHFLSVVYTVEIVFYRPI